MTTVTTYTSATGLRLAATVAGNAGAPPAVLLHGGGQTRRSWDATIDTLVESGWRTVALDMRGHGESDWAPDADYSLDAQVADLAAVVATLEAPPVLIGASMGGLASLVFTGWHPGTTRALVLVDVATRVETEGSERILNFMASRPDGFASLEEASDVIAAYNPGRSRPPDLAGLATVLRRRGDGRWVWHWDPALLQMAGDDPSQALNTGLLDDAARRVQVPTLLVRGKQSDVVSEAGAAHLLEIVPGARYVDVADAGHMVAGDRNDAFTTAVVEFLAALPRA